MKKFFSAVLALLLTASMLLQLTACSKSSSDAGLKMGQWLSLIADSFGMSGYMDSTPYFKKVPTSDTYFDAFQMAAEWDILAPNEKTDANTVVTWKDALVTLVNAGEFTDSDMSDDEKVKYGIEAFDSSIRDYRVDKPIPEEEAIILLALAQNKWTNRTFDKSTESHSYKDGVQDFTDFPDVKVSSNGADYIVPNMSKDNLPPVSSNSGSGPSGNGQAGDEGSSSADSAPSAKPGTSDPTTLKTGDLIVVPAPDNKLEKEYRKVKDIEIKDGETIIHTSDEDVELEDIYEELHVQGTVVPNAENTIIRDPDGNILNPETAEALKLARYDGSEPEYADLIYRPGQSGDMLNCTTNISKDFKVDDFTVKFKATLDKNKVGLSATVETDNFIKPKNKADKDKYGRLKGSVSVGLDELSVTHDFDWGFLKLKSAMLKINTKTSQHLKMSYSKEFNAVAGPDDNRNSSFKSNFKNAVMKSINGKGAKTVASRKVIKIASLDIYNAGVAKVCLDVNLQLKVDGSIEITCTQSNAVGVEYKKGNIRFMKEHSEKAEAQAKGSIEVNLGFGPALYALGLKKKLLGLEVRPGIGLEASATIRLADEENHLLQVCDDLNDVATPEEMDDVIKNSSITATHQEIEEIAASQGKVYKSEIDVSRVHGDFCLDFQVYFVLNAGLSTDTYLTDFVGAKFEEAVKLKVPLFRHHVDNWDWANASSKCRLSYKPFDLGKDESSVSSEFSDGNVNNSDNKTENSLIEMGETLRLSTMNVNIAVGGEKLVEIEQLPHGYSANDVLFVSKNGNVAVVDTSGVIRGLAEGSTIIYAQTKDEKFKAMVAVIVEGDYDMEFNSLNI